MKTIEVLEQEFVQELGKNREKEPFPDLAGWMPHLSKELDSADLSFLVMKSVSLAHSVKAREEEIKKQGFFARLMGALTGSTRRRQAENTQDLARLGLLSVQMIQHLLARQVMQQAVVLEMQRQLNGVTCAVINLQNDIRCIGSIARILELQAIAGKMNTRWGVPLRDLSPELAFLALAFEFYCRNDNFLTDATWIHFDNVLETVGLSSGRSISWAEIERQVAANPSVFAYLDGLGEGWNALALEMPGVVRIRELARIESEKRPLDFSEGTRPDTECRDTCLSLARELFNELFLIQNAMQERRMMEKLERIRSSLKQEEKKKIAENSHPTQSDEPEEVCSRRSYRLCNIHGELENNLVYSFRNRAGVNLEWRRTRPNVRFLPEDKDAVLRYGVPFSIRFYHLDGDVRTLAVKGQRYGIQLGWHPAEEPIHEWVIRGKTRGTPVRVGERFMIWNLEAQGYLNYMELPGDVVNLEFADGHRHEWCILK